MQSFLGVVNYHRDMWPKQEHILSPLSDESGKKTFCWTDNMENAFKQMKAILSEDTLMAYPNHNKPFHTYTDASDYQIGAVIMQDEKPVAYWSRKLNGAQKNYTTMEKQLFSIVIVLKEFRMMLLASGLHIHSDHKNLNFANLYTQ